MQVRDLIEQLQLMNPEAEVHFAYNYGDHWNTEVAPEVNEVIEGYVVDSAYHNMPKVVEEGEEDNSELVVIIRT